MSLRSRGAPVLPFLLGLSVLLGALSIGLSDPSAQMRIDGMVGLRPGAGGTTTSSGPFRAPDGTAAAPSYSFTSVPNAGLFASGGVFGISTAGVARTLFFNNELRQGSGGVFTWSSNANPFISGADTGFSRTAAGVVALGNGTQGDQSGLLVANHLTGLTYLSVTSKFRLSGTNDGFFTPTNYSTAIGSTIKVDALPTLTSGGGTAPSITAGSTPFAGSINVGTGAVTSPIAIAFNGTAFPSAPFCVVSSQLNATTNLHASSNTTQIQITATFGAGDIVSWMCVSAK